MRRRQLVYLRTAAGAVLSCLLTAAVLVALTKAVRPPAQDRRAGPGTAWLSGEVRGRAVLAAPGSQAGSVAVAIGDPSTYDVTQLRSLTAVLDQASGRLTLLDPALGTIKNNIPRVVPRGVGRLIGAGTSAFLLDPVAYTGRLVGPDGRLGDSVELAPFTSWAGSADGRLWLVDRNAGTYQIFSGHTPGRPSPFADAGADVSVTAVGGEPVVLDRTSRHLRWLARGVTQTLRGTAGSDPTQLFLQQPDPSGFGSCVAVADVDAVDCYEPAVGLVHQVALPAGAAAGSSLFSGPSGIVLAAPSSPDMTVGSWDAPGTAGTRPNPSARALTGRSTPTAILVDDPGSQYAITSIGGVVTPLDKFSKRTVVITADGPKIDLDNDTKLVSRLPPPTKANPANPDVRPPDDNGVNDLPTPAPDSARTRSGRAVNIEVLLNDSDPDGDPLAVVGVGTVARGTAKVLNGTTILYAPPVDFVGNVTFDYTVADPGGLQATSTVTVDVVGTNQNEGPLLQDDTATTVEAVPVTVPVLANDADPEGDPLSIVLLSNPAHGVAAVTAVGELRYEPAAGFTGRDDLQYTVSDGYGGRASAQLEVTVESASGTNRAPVAAEDRATVVAGKRVRVPVLDNDSDPDGNPLRVVSTGNVFGVTATIIGGASVEILPSIGVSGLVTVPYTIEDSGGLRASSKVVVVVDAPTPNRAPQAIDDSVVVASEAKSIDVVGNDVDPDGDPLTIVGFTQPATGGSVSKFSGTTLRFVPDQGFVSTTSFAYTVSDLDGLTSNATVVVQVVPPTGSGPVAKDDAAEITAGETARIYVLANDSHPDAISFALAGPPTVRAGVAVVNLDNSISYTPPAVAGTYTFTYSLRDFYGRLASAKVVVNVLPRPDPGSGGGIGGRSNQPPSAVDDRAIAAYQAPTQIDVLANDTDPENQTLVVSEVSSGVGGTPVIVNVVVPPGQRGSAVQVRFDPAPGFSGLASFTYTAADPGGLTAKAVVVVEVAQRPKVAPLARDDQANVVAGVPTPIDPRVNDLDLDGSVTALRIVNVVPLNGIGAVIQPDGQSISITAPAAGTYSIGYQIQDADGLTGAAIINVTAAANGNRPPVAVGDNYQSPSGLALTADVLSNDTDPEGGLLTLSEVGPPTAGSGTTTITGNQVVFTPAPGFSGPVTFTYVVRDNGGATATGTVSVTVTVCASLPPLVSDDSFQTPAGTPLFADLFRNDARPVGTLQLGRPGNGTVVPDGTPGAGPGAVVFTPAPGFTGRTTFAYTVVNACGVAASAAVGVTVTATNRPPVANDDQFQTPKNTPLPIDVLANDTDPDGDRLTVAQISPVTGGTVVPAAGQLLFTPTPGFTGVASFVYVASDPSGLRAQATVTINVSAPNNRPPNAVNDDATAVPGVDTAVDVLANDSDPDPGDSVSIVQIGVVLPPGSGTATLTVVAGRPMVLFHPLAFATPATFTYTITDTRGATAAATVTVTPAANHTPIARNDVATATVGTPVAIDVLSNDTDPDNDTLDIVGVTVTSPPGAGTATIVNRKIEFVATAAGPITFDYTISDPSGATATATVAVTATSPVNHNPIASADTASITSPAQSVSVNVIANDTDVDGDQLVLVTSGPPNATPVPTPDDGVGTVQVVGNTITFTILPTFTGTGLTIVRIPYVVSDGRGGTDTSTLTISVTT